MPADPKITEHKELQPLFNDYILTVFTQAYVEAIKKRIDHPVKYAAEKAKIPISRGYGIVQKNKRFGQIAKDLLLDATKKTFADAERITYEIACLALANPADMYREDGTLKNIKEMPEECQRAIREIKQDDITIGDSDKVIGQSKEYKMHAKIEALKLLAQIHKMIGQQDGGPAGNNGGTHIHIYLPDNGRNPIQGQLVSL